MQQADDKGCFADFDKAIAIDEDNPNIHHHRGQVINTFFLITDLLKSCYMNFLGSSKGVSKKSGLRSESVSQLIVM